MDGKHTINGWCTLCGKCVEACNFGVLKIIGTEMTVDELLPEVMADLDFYRNSGGGITLSGGEPLLNFSFAMELLKRCKEIGVDTCVETSGFIASSQFKKALSYTDVLLYDYKVAGSNEHEKYTGVPNEPILKNLEMAYRQGVPVILRCPVIPGINDTDQHFEGICALNRKYPNLMGIEILPYHKMGNSKRTGIGIAETLNHLETVPSDVSAQWIEKLKRSGCEKAKIG